MLNFLKPAAEWGVVSTLKILKTAGVHGRAWDSADWFAGKFVAQVERPRCFHFGLRRRREVRTGVLAARAINAQQRFFKGRSNRLMSFPPARQLKNGGPEIRSRPLETRNLPGTSL
jgi:hypothetical protein